MNPTLDDITRDALLRRALDGDASAFWRLIEPHRQMIFATSLGVTRDPEKAEDIAHDVYIRAFSTLGNLRTNSRLAGWLHTMARNISYEHLRKSDRDARFAEKPQPSPPPVISVPDMLVREQDLSLLGDAMADLPEPHRIVLGFKYLNNMSCREISDTLGIGVEAAKSRLFEARKALRARMKAAEEKSAAPHSPAAAARGVQNPPQSGVEKKVLES